MYSKSGPIFPAVLDSLRFSCCLHVGVPGVGLGFAHVIDPAGVLLPGLGGERDVLDQVEMPGIVEEQVGLTGPADHHAVLQQLDLDDRGLERAHAAQQGVGAAHLPGLLAVNFHLGGGLR